MTRKGCVTLELFRIFWEVFYQSDCRLAWVHKRAYQAKFLQNIHHVLIQNNPQHSFSGDYEKVSYRALLRGGGGGGGAFSVRSFARAFLVRSLAGAFSVRSSAGASSVRSLAGAFSVRSLAAAFSVRSLAGAFSVRYSTGRFPCGASQKLFPCTLSHGLSYAHLQRVGVIYVKRNYKTFFSVYDAKRLKNVLRESFPTIKVYSISLKIITNLLLSGWGTSKMEGISPAKGQLRDFIWLSHCPSLNQILEINLLRLRRQWKSFIVWDKKMLSFLPRS